MPDPETLRDELCELQGRLLRVEIMLAQIPGRVNGLIANPRRRPLLQRLDWLPPLLIGVSWVNSAEWTTP